MDTGNDLVLRDYAYSIEGAAYGSTNDPRVLGERFVKTLDDLGRVDAIFSDWLLTDSVKLEQVEIGDVRRNIAALVEKNANRDGFEQRDPAEGYLMQAANGSSAGPRNVSISISTNSRMSYFFDLGFGDDIDRYGVDAALVNYPLFRASLLSLIANWPCPWAAAIGFKMKLRHVPVGPYIRVETESFCRPTWIGYLSADQAGGFAPPADLVCERTPDGGLLMMAGKGRLDSSDAGQIKNADLLTGIMAERGYDPRQ